jgi:hypothetical protein
MKKVRGLLALIMTASFATAGFSFISDFNGTYRKLPTVTDPWCGRSITIKKIRFNKYRITWELLNGDNTVVELIGNPQNDTIDFRKAKGTDLYGYTYTLADGKNRLVVTLAVPGRNVVCHFTRIKK